MPKTLNESNSLLITENCQVNISALLDILRDIEILIRESHLVLLFSNNNLSSVGVYLLSEKYHVPIIVINDEVSLASKLELISTYRPSLIASTVNFHLGHATVTEHVFDKLFENLFIYQTKDCVSVHKDLMLLLSTSGSTGSPKLVKLSRENVYSNSEAILSYLPIVEEDKCLLNLPISYSYGISILNTHLLKNASIYLTNESFLSKKLWVMLSTLNVNSLAGVPEMIKMLKFIKLENRSEVLNNLKYVTQAGGKLDIGLRNYFNEFFANNFIEFYIMYGQTEATARMSFLSPDCFRLKTASVGRPIPGGSFEILGNQKNKEGYTEGEIIYNGRNVMLGYASNYSELSVGDELNGVLHTGDLGYLDEDGYLFITGRKKRIVKVSGNRISLDHLESRLSSRSIQNAIINIDDKIKIFIKDKADEIKVTEELNSLGIGKNNFSLVVVRKFPLNSNGKVNYVELSLTNDAK
jgi:long-chain acyl-CoA synthetase